MPRPDNYHDYYNFNDYNQHYDHGGANHYYDHDLDHYHTGSAVLLRRSYINK